MLDFAKVPAQARPRLRAARSMTVMRAECAGIFNLPPPVCGRGRGWVYLFFKERASMIFLPTPDPSR